MGIILATICIFGAIAFCIIVVRASYRNGVTDGYGYSQEPWNPGYRAAGEFLKKEMSHRWPELLMDDDYETCRPNEVCSECRHACSSDCDCWCHGVQK